MSDDRSHVNKNFERVSCKITCQNIVLDVKSRVRLRVRWKKHASD